jgi:phenylpropionate dioxygenase-like ring-hydroxylating dioxygenase large terminal subunit
MIRNQWYVILNSNEVKKDKITSVKRMGENLIAWRDNSGQLTIMEDKCPHRGVALRLANKRSDCIICPFHGFEYDLSGTCKYVPANGRKSNPPNALHVKTYPTQEEHGFVYIWWGEKQANYPSVPWFESIGPDMVYATIKDHWANHYSRAIENQLDVVHLPFIHRTTIGRGNRTLVNGPIAKLINNWSGDHLINLWVYNEIDNGQYPKKSSELPEPNVRPFLQFRYGNIWHNWISDQIRVVIAFVPLDNENTLLYIRFYHSVKFPVVSQLFGWLGSLGNFMIERQDRRVVITQRPHRPDLDIGEILIPGDNPIILYRKVRRILIEKGKAT